MNNNKIRPSINEDDKNISAKRSVSLILTSIFGGKFLVCVLDKTVSYARRGLVIVSESSINVTLEMLDNKSINNGPRLP